MEFDPHGHFKGVLSRARRLFGPRTGAGGEVSPSPPQFYPGKHATAVESVASSVEWVFRMARFSCQPRRPWTEESLDQPR